MSPASEMDFVGHSGSHAPQAMQVSSMVSAITRYLKLDETQKIADHSAKQNRMAEGEFGNCRLAVV
jgi:hypothetical protein